MNNKTIIKRLELSPDLKTNPKRLKDFIEMGQNIYLADNDEEEGRRVCEKGRNIALVQTIKNPAFYEVYLLSLKYLARYFKDFDSYMIFLEHKREPEAQFYLPRREVLKNKLGIVQGFQDILDDKLDILTVSVVPGAGKTTLAEFFLSFYMGLFPDSFNLYVSYTGTIADMFHRSMCDIMFSGEYAWEEIFPNVKLESRSDKEKYINLNSYKPFKSLTCRSIDASMTGVTRASGIILSDDLVSGTEEAMNVQRLENLYQKYVNDAKSRRIKGCKEISIATRWSVHDPIGHFIRENEGNDRARFLAYGCYDENGESQFDYKYDKGFDTFYFKEMENVMDEITFKCLYMSDPIEREGLLYKKEELQFYLGGLPCDDGGKTKEADAILGVCDTKDVGTDFNCLLVVYGYGKKFYLEDVVYDNGSPYTLDELNANCLVRNKVQMCQFESNKEGSRTGNEVQRLVNEKGGRCSITKKYTTTNKETKIIVNSDWVKKHIVFKDPSEWTDMYKKFMQGVLSYVQMGKNKNDDGVDALAMLALYINSFESSQVEVISRASLGF